jgi:hypothetical protein
MSDTAPSASGPQTVVRPTKESQWTLFAVLLVVCLFALVAIVPIGWGHWPDTAAELRIAALRVVALAAILCVALLVIAFMSPYVGTVKASGLGASLEVDGS